MCQNIHFYIKWEKQFMEFVMPRDTTIDQVKKEIYFKTGILPQNQKLLNKVHLLGGITLANAGIKTGSKLVLLGQNTDVIKNVTEKSPPNNVLPAPVISASEESLKQKRRQDALDCFLFGRIEVLDLPNSTEAASLLEKLTKDVGIKNIMKKHGWHVEALKELTPLNLKINGYNRGRGMEIAIKLRMLTLPLSGGGNGGEDIPTSSWRSWTEIMETMLHELAHCQWDGHDANFHTLNRQLNKEVITLNWTKGTNKMLGGNWDAYNPNPRNMEDSLDSLGTITKMVDGRRLGGVSSEIGIMDSVPANVMAGIMAEVRLSSREQQLMNECGNDTNISDTVTPVKGFEQTEVPTGITENVLPASSTLGNQLDLIPAESSFTTSIAYPTCPICNFTFTQNESERFITNHVTQCLTHHPTVSSPTSTKLPPPPPTQFEPCPICGITFPGTSTEQSISLHISECLQNSTSSYTSTSACTTASSCSGTTVAVTTTTTTTTTGVDTLTNQQCPICGIIFESVASVRFMTNHIDHCLKNSTFS